MKLQIPVTPDAFGVAIVTARGVPSDGPRCDQHPDVRNTRYIATDTGAVLGECYQWPNGDAFYYLDQSLVPAPMARAYLTEAANTLGFDSIHEADDHQAWLANYRAQASIPSAVVD